MTQKQFSSITESGGSDLAELTILNAPKISLRCAEAYSAFRYRTVSRSFPTNKTFEMRNYYDWLREYYRGRWERDTPTVEVDGNN